MYERFVELLELRKITAYKVCKENNISTATITAWKKGIYTPKREKLQKIADYLGVTVDYLMGIDETPPEPKFYFSEKDEEIVDSFMKLTDENKCTVRAFILFLLENQQNKKPPHE